MAGLSADDIGLLEDAQDADDEKPTVGYRAPAPKRARASADDIAMFGSPGDTPAKPAGKTGGASTDDIAMFGRSPAADRPEWLNRGPKAATPVPRDLAPQVPLDELAADIQRGKEGLNKPTTAQSIDNGLSSMISSAGNTATLGAYDKVRHALNSAIGIETPLAQEQSFREEHPSLDAAGKALGYLNPYGAPSLIARTASTGLAAATKTAPAAVQALLATRPVAGALGGAVTNAATTGAEDLAGDVPLREIPADVGRSALVGGAIGGGLGTVPVLARGAATAAEKLAGRAEARQVERAADRTLEGGTKRTRGRLEGADGKLEDVIREYPAVRAAAMKSDAALAEQVKSVGRRGSEEAAKIYEQANADSIKPPEAAPAKPGEIELTDRDIMEAEAVPERIDTSSEPKTARIENPNFPTRRASPDVGATVPAGRARVIEGPAAASATAPGIGESESLLASAQAAESEATKLTAKAERYGRQADGFVNEELSAKAAKRASVYEIRADEARQRAESLRSQAEAAKARDALPDAVPVVEAPLEPAAPGVGGGRPADAISNMDRSIARWEKGNTEEIARAKQLQDLRDTFAESTRGQSDVLPLEKLREQQSVYQKIGYQKAIKGQQGYEEMSARIEAARQASQDVGDVIIKQVTGMDYATAKAAAKADPNSVAGRLFKANRDIQVANLVQAHLDAKTGQNPSWARNVLAAAKVAGHATTAGLAGLTAHHLGPEAGMLVAGTHAAVAAAPYVRRATDAMTVGAAPGIRSLSDAAGRLSNTITNPADLARFIQAERAAKLQARAQEKRDNPTEEFAAGR